MRLSLILTTILAVSLGMALNVTAETYDLVIKHSQVMDHVSMSGT